ncbi:hypothetical protein N0V88_001808 [Collariella sp. IMI 366227]|nr:hypothetical protein N0V88_001808 [Collariella sp. IMI 366227]
MSGDGFITIHEAQPQRRVNTPTDILPPPHPVFNQPPARVFGINPHQPAGQQYGARTGVPPAPQPHPYTTATPHTSQPNTAVKISDLRQKQPSTVEEAREALSEYFVIRLERFDDISGYASDGSKRKLSWKRALREEVPGISNIEAAKTVRELNRTSISVTRKKGMLSTDEQRQIESALQDLQKNDNQWYQTMLVQLDDRVKFVKPKEKDAKERERERERVKERDRKRDRQRKVEYGLFGVTRVPSKHHSKPTRDAKKPSAVAERVTLTAYFKRAPRPEVDPIAMLRHRNAQRNSQLQRGMQQARRPSIGRPAPRIHHGSRSSPSTDESVYSETFSARDDDEDTECTSPTSASSYLSSQGSYEHIGADPKPTTKSRPAHYGIPPKYLRTEPGGPHQKDLSQAYAAGRADTRHEALAMAERIAAAAAMAGGNTNGDGVRVIQRERDGEREGRGRSRERKEYRRESILERRRERDWSSEREESDSDSDSDRETGREKEQYGRRRERDVSRKKERIWSRERSRERDSGLDHENRGRHRNYSRERGNHHDHRRRNHSRSLDRSNQPTYHSRRARSRSLSLLATSSPRGRAPTLTTLRRGRPPRSRSIDRSPGWRRETTTTATLRHHRSRSTSLSRSRSQQQRRAWDGDNSRERSRSFDRRQPIIRERIVRVTSPARGVPANLPPLTRAPQRSGDW